MSGQHPCPRCGRPTETLAKTPGRGRERMCDECRHDAKVRAGSYREEGPPITAVERYLEQVVRDESAPPWARQATAAWLRSRKEDNDGQARDL